MCHNNPKVSIFVLAIALTLLITPLASAANMISNGSFEDQVPGALPPGWTSFSSRSILGNHFLFTKGDAADGDWYFTLHDDSDSVGHGLRTVPVPAEAGIHYMASAAVRVEQGSVTLYLEFIDSSGKRLKAPTVKAYASKAASWTTISVDAEAPAGTTQIALIIYSMGSNVGTSHIDDVRLEELIPSQWAKEDIEFVSADDQLDYSPAHESVMTTNPPSFVWIPIPGAISYNLEYSTDPEFAPEATTRVSDIDISIYTPGEVFDASQTWYWRVQAMDSDGTTSQFTETRIFRITPDATILPLPSLDEVRARIPKEHPRLFVTSQNIDQFRMGLESQGFFKDIFGSLASKSGNTKLKWKELEMKANDLITKPLPQEPPHCKPGGTRDINLWREYRITVEATNDMETLAFVYRITGDEKYGEAARKLMLHIASWDPTGATSAAVNDESSLPILYKMSRAYTWAYNALSPEDRKIICDVMRIRGNEAYRILKNRPYESRPYASHAGRSLGFLGEAAIAFLGEIPEAEEWFDYITRIFFAIYPAWGGDPGGWAEGHAYWTSYMNRVLWYLDALDVATGLNLYEKAFFKNTGVFKLYTHPPYSKMGPFGDHADTPPSKAAGEIMAQFAAVYQNPYFLWYAQSLNATNQGGVMGYIRSILHPIGELKAKAPKDQPTSNYFPDVGWVVFHQKLGEESIQFMFKSSPYGSFSHSMADQNTFTIEAYGAPLAISSGYRPWYGSKHHMGWTKTTQAQNGILVDGRGQMVQSIAAKGEILDFLNGSSFDYTAGDAAKAYGFLLDKFVRHVVYIRPDIFVIYDDLESSSPRTYSWLLHGYRRMNIQEDTGTITMTNAASRLNTQLWASHELEYTQTDKFAVPLDEPMNKPIQWHLTASTKTPSKEAQFLAVLKPVKLSDKRAISTSRINNGVVVEDKNLTATILFGSEEDLKADNVEGHANVLAWQKAKSTEGFLMVQGTHLKTDKLEINSELPISTELTLGKNFIQGTMNVRWMPGIESVKVTITSPLFTGAKVSLEDGDISWEFKDGALHMVVPPLEGQNLSIKISK